MRSRLFFMFCLMLALIVAACGGSTPETPAEEPETSTESTSSEAEEPAEEMEEEEMAEEEMEEESMDGVEIRFTYYADGNEADVMQGLVDAFHEANSDVTVILDNVPYSTIDEQLPVQVETGEGPDMARITNFGTFSGNLLDMSSYMADPDYVRANFPAPVLDALGEPGGIYGFPDGFTVTGPYVNKTLFDQAGVDMPGADAGWADWSAAAAEVAEATGVQYAISIDRTGHRFAGPAMSSGATLIDADGNFTVDTEGYRAFAEELNSWHEAGITPSEVWLVGDSVNSCIDFFKSGDLVMCMSGSWQINGLAADVGDAFDWVVVPNPSGPGGSTGVAGGAAIVAFADTEHPEEVSRFMEFLAQAENYAQFSAGTLILPAHTEVASGDVEYATEDAQVLAALAAYTAEIPKLQDQAVQLNVHPFAFAYYRNSANRIAQYLAGELTIDDALAGLQEDIDDAIAEAMASVPAEEEAAEEEMAEEMMELEAAEIRFTYYADGNEADVMQGLIDQFNDVYPQITVILDNVPYSTVDEQLPVQVETGEGPDMARITNFGTFSGNLLDMSGYMADPDYVRANFPAPVLDALGEPGGIYGFPDGFTVTGPYVNKTLFDQAGVEMPGADAGWADWSAAAAEVAEATGVQYAISIDRTGHRFAGPAMSSGATLIDADGNFTVDTEGYRAFAEELNSWHEAGITPSEVWLVGDSVNSCIDFFKSGDLVMCMSGSWQINGLAADVGDAFDWVVVPNPSGPGGSTGVAGGAAIVAFADTEHPEAVSAFMEFLAQAENYAQFSAGTLILPAHTEAAAGGIEFETEDAQVLAALEAYTAEIPKLQDQAVQLNVHPFAFAYYRNSANRIAQYLAGELTIDDALAGMQEDIDDAITEAGG
ncbi:MAG: extracellular solute-binding protein [Ardenticatenaceae bacterium]|nr:extracellular solute-binding protein [Ardenticatenaceae bacterium]